MKHPLEILKEGESFYCYQLSEVEKNADIYGEEVTAIMKKRWQEKLEKIRKQIEEKEKEYRIREKEGNILSKKII